MALRKKEQAILDPGLCPLGFRHCVPVEVPSRKGRRWRYLYFKLVNEREEVLGTQQSPPPHTLKKRMH